MDGWMDGRVDGSPTRPPARPLARPAAYPLAHPPSARPRSRPPARLLAHPTARPPARPPLARKWLPARSLARLPACAHARRLACPPARPRARPTRCSPTCLPGHDACSLTSSPARSPTCSPAHSFTQVAFSGWTTGQASCRHVGDADPAPCPPEIPSAFGRCQLLGVVRVGAIWRAAKSRLRIFNRGSCSGT